VLLVVEDISAKRELEQLRQEFISMMTHDLRTPLTSIKMFLQMVGEGVFDERPEKLKERCGGLELETDRLLGMINSVLDLHKMEAGKLQLVVEDVSLVSVVLQAVEAVSAWAQASGITLDVPEIPGEIFVRCDRDYTVRVLVNLVSNAVKFSERGQSVRITVRPDGEFVTLGVIDRGPGIPDDFRQKLFNRFEQARLSDARVKGGTGLGLAIAKAIVEEQGGKIGVESQLGHGCTFWFTLPIKVR
jgi:signal transduction histidine kinase